MSIGSIRGLKSGITKLDGFSNVVYYGDSAKLAKLAYPPPFCPRYFNVARPQRAAGKAPPRAPGEETGTARGAAKHEASRPTHKRGAGFNCLQPGKTRNRSGQTDEWRAERGIVLAAKHSSTLRRVLEYLPQSTLADASRHGVTPGRDGRVPAPPPRAS